MLKDLVTASGRSREYEVICGAWAATTLLFVMTMSTWPANDTDPEDPSFWASGAGWGVGTLAVAVVVGLMAVAAVKDVLATRRGGTPWPTRNGGLGSIPGTTAWFAGGLFSLLRFVYAQADVCGGGDGWSFGCRQRSGLLLTVLGLVFTASATLVLVVLTLSADRPRLSRWLSPVLILGLYLLALRMWMPHVGLGVPSRDQPMP